MTSDKPTSKISSEACDDALLAEIKRRKWWQGSIVDHSSLAECLSQNGSESPSTQCDHWVVASQTCNLHNPQFERVRLVELVGAKSLANLNPSMSDGSNPRKLHACATHEDHSMGVYVECDIQSRLWIDRKLLAQLDPCKYSLRDKPGAPHLDRQQDMFAGWLARSYTRLELSDELNQALDESTIADMLYRFAKANQKDIYGIFLGIAPDTVDVAIEKNACVNPVDIVPPCNIEVSVVVYEEG